MEYILPYRIDNTDVTDKFEYYMSECHWINARPQFADYKERELVEAARAMLASVDEVPELPSEIPDIVVNVPNGPDGITARTGKDKGKKLSTLFIVIIVLLCIICGILLFLLGKAQGGEGRSEGMYPVRARHLRPGMWVIMWTGKMQYQMAQTGITRNREM